MKGKQKKLFRLCCLMIALLCLLTACQEPEEADSSVSEGELTLADFADKRIGVMDGTIQVDMVRELFPDAEILLYSSVADMPLALEAGAVDAFSGDSYVVSEILRNKPTLTTINTPIGYVEAAIAFPKTDEGAALRDRMNVFLRKCRDDGSLDEMSKLWFSDKGSEAKVDMSGLPETGPLLELATTGIAIPFSFYENGEVQGFDIDLVVRFCREYGYRLNIETMSFPSIIPGLVSEKYGLAANGIFVTDERRESINFSDTYCALDIVLVTEKVGVTAEPHDTFLSNFEKTFIREDRWKLIARGLWTTVYLSALSVALGTLLGFGLCFLRRTGRGIARALTTICLRILQGTPQLVLLMVMYYLVFAGSGISGEWVAIITFSIYFGASFSTLLCSGLDAVDAGQLDAALAIGFTKRGAYSRIILPQVIPNILPVYQGEVISLIKMTSIVGYIAVQDLTKMGDIIRNRTYQAFFPLIVTAVLYFMISWLFTLALKVVQKRIQPNRNRKIKGVIMH